MGTALITGASAGLGAEYSRLFAADKHDLVLVARRRDRLEALARELESAHKVKARALWYELRGSGVTATVSCPGATARVERGSCARRDVKPPTCLTCAKQGVPARQRQPRRE